MPSAPCGTMRRLVLDTGVFVSSLLLRRGVPAQLLDAWRAGEFLLVVSPAIVAEIRHTLAYPRIRRKYRLTDEDVEVVARIRLLKPGAISHDRKPQAAWAVQIESCITRPHQP